MSLPIEDIVQVTITTQTASVSRAGFGTPLVAAFHTNNTDRVTTYSSSTALVSMVEDGFETDDPAYLAVQKIISQNPRPRQVKVGRRDNDWTQVVHLTPGTPAEGDVFSVEVDGLLATSTADGTPSLGETCTDLATKINALTDIEVTADGSSGTYVVVTSDDPCKLHTFMNYTSNLTCIDMTAEADIADDLNAIRAVDPDFYGLIIDSNATSEIKDAAEWAETQKILFIAQSADSDIPTSEDTDDLGSVLKLAGYVRTALIYQEDISSFACAAWLGKVLPMDPGSETWAFKSLAGVTVSSGMSPSQAGYLDGKNVNHYTLVGGLSITRHGKAASGMYLDITRFTDWLTARIMESVFALIANAAKLPYTDESVDLVKGQIYARLLEGVERGGLVAGTIAVEAPLVADVDSADRADRILPDVTFGGRLAGAIHTVIIQGNLTI